MTDERYEVLKNNVFNTLHSPEELWHWVYNYLDLRMPYPGDSIDDESTSSPIDAMYEIYAAVRDNTGNKTPGYIMLSAREAYKTLSASILEVLLMLHFKTTIAHMAAIKSQSDKAISYVNSFVKKLMPYLEDNGWKKVSDSKTKIEFLTPDGKSPYIVIIIATLTGANSEHTNLFFCDEIDVIRDPNAYEEAKLIPGVYEGRFPITVKLSTRKFAFGLMNSEIEKAEEAKEKILRWNVLDIAERCPKSRHQPNEDGSTEKRYVRKKLPLEHISPDEFESLGNAQKQEYEEAEAHPGCMTCSLFAVCRGNLAAKPKRSQKGLYKPIDSIIVNFSKVGPDMAEAQLLCWKPSSKGLVYPRIVLEKGAKGSAMLSLEDAYEKLMGDPFKGVIRLEHLVSQIRALNIPIHAGVDWGFTKEFAIVVVAKMPTGEAWVLYTYGEPELEFSEQLEKAKEVQEKFGVSKWWVDQAYPSSIKTFNKNGLKSPSFTKDVMGGVNAVREMIVNAKGRRRFFIIDTEENQKLVSGFKMHHFKLDAAGNPTKNIAEDNMDDCMDGLRYVFQNVFGTDAKGKGIIMSSKDPDKQDPGGALKKEIETRVQDTSVDQPRKTSKKGGFYWNV